MQEESKAFGCGAKPATNVQTNSATPQALPESSDSNERRQQMIQVGKPAPDFDVPAYYKGEFTNVKLSDYKGKWVLLCFYPGDFTFV